MSRDCNTIVIGGGSTGEPSAAARHSTRRKFTMRTLSKSFPFISLPALALGTMLSAGAVSAQTTATNGAGNGSTDKAVAASERPREIVQVETEIPPGVESGWHVHPGEEVGYIIAGKVEMKVQGRPTGILNAGDGFLIPPRTPHRLDRIEEAYDLFANQRDGVFKVAISP
jgi:quercetin dioxygenase-like cupin family protein